MKFELDSAAFDRGRPIPKRHTGDGRDVSPPLSWYAVPEGTQELALVCDDPDAPRDEPWVHWVIYKIPTAKTSLRENLPREGRLEDPAGVLQGVNSWGQTGYRGPAPPEGHGVHHYHFRLHALDAPLDVTSGLTKDELLQAMDGHIIGQAELVGTYERTGK